MTTLPYRIDPFFRDERGRFVPRPDVYPAPLNLLLNAGATRKRVAGPHFLARAIREGEGKPFRVVISERAA
jgi:hypothetical protein